MKVTVIGCGRWGTFIAWYLNNTGHNVNLYGRKESGKFQQLVNTYTNGTVTLNENIFMTSDLQIVEKSDVLIISVGSQSLRNVMSQLSKYDLNNRIIVLCMKGIEIGTGKRLTQIVSEYVNDKVKVAVWIGPGHVQEFLSGMPNCMVIDSNDEYCKQLLVKEFSSDLIRFYYGTDLIGNEIGAASKNVMGIAAGMLDGFGMESLKGSLMARGTLEISRLIKKLGGNELSAYGLCHLGDYEATLFSPYSHNRIFGEKFIKKEKYNDLAEGYYTAKAIVQLGEKYDIELPICEAVYDILYKGTEPEKALKCLFLRELKNEF